MRASIRQFALSSGLSEGDDPKQLPPGTLAVLENCVWKKIGRVDKRFGTRSLAVGTLGAAKRLFTRGDELCLVDGQRIYARASSSWVDCGRVPEVGLTWSVANDTVMGMKCADVAYANGQVMHAWVTGDPRDETIGGDVYIQITDATTGTFVQASKNIFTGVTSVSHLRIVTDGASFVVLFVSGGVLYSYVGGTQTILQTDVNDPGIGRYLYNAFDACALGSSFAVAYALTGGGIKLVRYSFATVPLIQATGAVTSETSAKVSSISIDGAVGSNLFVLYAREDSGTIRHAMANAATLAQTLAPATLQSPGAITAVTCAVHRLASGSAIYAFSYDGPIGLNEDKGILRITYVSSAGVPGVTIASSFKRLLSRPFTLGGRDYVYACDFTSVSASAGNMGTLVDDAYLLDITSDLARLSPREAGKTELLTSGRWFSGNVSNVALPSATEALAALPFTGDERRQGLRAVRATVGASLPLDMWRAASIDRESYLAGGVYAAFDGVAALPFGFAHPAYVDAGDTTASSGGAMAAGDYLYSVVPERRSATGILYRGPSAITYRLTVPATGKVTLSIVPINIAVDVEPQMLAIYRSIVNATDEVLHRRSIEPTTAFLVNSTAFAMSFVDSAADSSIGHKGLAAQAAIYTAGSELDDFQPPACVTQAFHRNRLFLLAGDEQTVFVSKDSSSNTGVAPGFHPDVRLFFPEPVIALASMDEKFIALSESRPWYVLGDGPALDGEQSDYTNPTPVQSDVGCINPRSVVSTPDGVMFLSSRGFMLLTRGLEVVYIGGDVEDTLEAFPVVTSAVLVPKQKQVRWTCNNVGGTAGRVIVLDYQTKQWSVFRYRDTETGTNDTPIADAVMWAGAWTFATPGGAVFAEDETTFLDGGVDWVYANGATAWICEAGPLGYQHIRRAMLLGDKYSRCQLTLSYGFNFIDASVQGYTWTADALDEIGDGINVGMHVGSRNGASPRARAFKVVWSDGPPPGSPAGDGEGPSPYGSGQGFNLSAIGIEFIPKPDMDRRSAKART